MKGLWLLAAAAILAAGPVRAATPPETLVVAKNIDDIVSLDPAQAYEFTSGEVLANVYDRLVQYDADDITKLAGGLAESWKVSEDGRSIAFTLREGAKFESGNPVRPEDVVFSFRRVVVLNKAPAFILTQLGWTPDNIDEMVRKTGDREVTVSTSRDYGSAFFLNVLASRPASIVDEATVMKNAKDGDLGNAWLNRNSAGAGPFRLRTYNPGESVVLAANPGYHKGAPGLRSVVLRHIKEPGTQRLLIEKGDADVVRDLGPDQIDAVRKAAGIRVAEIPQAAIHFFSLNLKDEKLRNPALWEAMRYLVDYEGIARLLLKDQMRVHQAFWPEGFPGALTDKPFRLDVEKAKGILEQGGVAPGLTLDMDVINSSPFMDIAQSLQSTMARAGIKINLVTGPGSQVITKYRARNHQMMLLYWGPDFMDPHSNAKAFSYNVDNADDAPQSTTTWRNSWLVPELSKLTMDALSEKDEQKRLAMYLDLQKRVQASSPIVIMFQAQNLVAMSDKVKGYVHGPTSDLVYYRKVTK